MKTLLILIASALILMAGCLAHETSKKYYSEIEPENYILLKPDGTYLIIQKNVNPFGGNWQQDDNNVYLFHPFGTFTLKKEKTALVDHAGDRWVISNPK